MVEKIRWNKKHRKNIEKDWVRHRNALKSAAESLLEKEYDASIARMNQ